MRLVLLNNKSCIKEGCKYFLSVSPSCGVTFDNFSPLQLWPRSAWWEPRLALMSPLLSRFPGQSLCLNGINVMEKNRPGKPRGTPVLLTKAKCKQLALTAPLPQRKQALCIPLPWMPQTHGPARACVIAQKQRKREKTDNAADYSFPWNDHEW